MASFEEIIMISITGAAASGIYFGAMWIKEKLEGKIKYNRLIYKLYKN